MYVSSSNSCSSGGKKEARWRETLHVALILHTGSAVVLQDSSYASLTQATGKAAYRLSRAEDPGFSPFPSSSLSLSLSFSLTHL